MRNRYELGCSTGTACLPTNRGSLDDDNQTKRSSIHSVSVIIAFVVALFLLALYAIAYAIYGILPNPLKLSDEVGHLHFATPINYSTFLGQLSRFVYSRKSAGRFKTIN